MVLTNPIKMVGLLRFTRCLYFPILCYVLYAFSFKVIPLLPGDRWITDGFSSTLSVFAGLAFLLSHALLENKFRMHGEMKNPEATEALLWFVMTLAIATVIAHYVGLNM